MRERTKILIRSIIFGYLCMIIGAPFGRPEKIVNEPINNLNFSTVSISTIVIEPLCSEYILIPEIKENEKEEITVEEIENIKVESLSIDDEIELVSQEDIELLALVTMAEAEGECEYGKRMVIDTVLNRVDSKHFPDTIRDVIYQQDQFSSMWNGRVERSAVTDEVLKLVVEEIKSRTNYDTIYFNANHYSKYGEPMFTVGAHYFSSY